MEVLLIYKPWNIIDFYNLDSEHFGWNNNHAIGGPVSIVKIGYTPYSDRLGHAWGSQDMLSPPQRSLAHPNDPVELKHGFDRLPLLSLRLGGMMTGPKNGLERMSTKIHNKYIYIYTSTSILYSLVLFDMFVIVHAYLSYIYHPKNIQKHGLKCLPIVRCPLFLMGWPSPI